MVRSCSNGCGDTNPYQSERYVCWSCRNILKVKPPIKITPETKLSELRELLDKFKLNSSKLRYNRAGCYSWCVCKGLGNIVGWSFNKFTAEVFPCCPVRFDQNLAKSVNLVNLKYDPIKVLKNGS